MKKLLSVLFILMAANVALSMNAVDQNKKMREFRQMMAKVDAIFGTDRGTSQEIAHIKKGAAEVLPRDGIMGADNFRPNKPAIFIRFIQKPTNPADKKKLSDACAQAAKLPAYIITIYRGKYSEVNLNCAFATIGYHDEKWIKNNRVPLAAISGIGLLGTAAAVGYMAWKKRSGTMVGGARIPSNIQSKELMQTTVIGLGLTAIFGAAFLIDEIRKDSRELQLLGLLSYDVLWKGKRIA